MVAPGGQKKEMGDEPMGKADIGVAGLAVMGGNLALNILSRGFSVAVFNRTADRVDAFMDKAQCPSRAIPAYTYEQLANSLKRPRKILLMVKAGPPVDDVIAGLLPYLDRGDVLIDGGNSFFEDTRRRCAELKERGVLFVGCGISGGEEGALHGPSLMPGGDAEAWPEIREIFTAISARAEDGAACCGWIGPEGSGHYTKMVHNGIEYGDMQLICEAYLLLRDMLAMSADEIAECFRLWNETELESYLMEISAVILGVKDTDGLPLVDKIADAAAQKGTGKWTSVSALDNEVPLSAITEAVFARYLSAQTQQRERAAQLFGGAAPEPELRVSAEELRRAALAGKIILYAQGFSLLGEVSGRMGWRLDLGGIALLWRSGCIIRSPMLDRISDAFAGEPSLSSVMFSPYFAALLRETVPSLRRVVAAAALRGLPVPVMSAALSYFDALSAGRLPANLLQAQRDYFGAHTFRRTDLEGVFHYIW